MAVDRSTNDNRCTGVRTGKVKRKKSIVQLDECPRLDYLFAEHIGVLWNAFESIVEVFIIVP